MQTLEIVSIILTAVIGIVVTGLAKQLTSFIKEQRSVNEANAMANRSLQRDVIYRYFRIVVEQGDPITPEEFDHVSRCYKAYAANGGNDTGTLMWRKIQEHVKLITKPTHGEE